MTSIAIWTQEKLIKGKGKGLGVKEATYPSIREAIAMYNRRKAKSQDRAIANYS